MTLYLSSKGRKFYLIATKDSELLDNPYMHQGVMLINTFLCPAFSEFKCRSLISGEAAQLAEESLEGLGEVLF